MIVKRLSTPRYRYGGGSSYSNRTKYRYGGNGIISNLISRKLIPDGNVIRKLINTVGKRNIVQKAVNAVQDGVTNTIKTQTQKGIEELASNAIARISKNNNNKKKKKRTKEQQNILDTTIQSLATIPTTAEIEGIIRSGKGIVYD